MLCGPNLMADDTDLATEFAVAERDLIQALEDMLVILGRGHWSPHFLACRSKLLAASTWNAKSSAASAIRSVYGGMGSFNDWYVDGDCERGDFDDIRTRLYDLSLIYQDSRYASLRG